MAEEGGECNMHLKVRTQNIEITFSLKWLCDPYVIHFKTYVVVRSSSLMNSVNSYDDNL